MSDIIIDYTIIRNDKEIDLEICGYYNPYIPANLSGHPDYWYPDEGGEIEIESITDDNGPWNGLLSSKEVYEIERCLIKQFYRNF